MTLYTEIADYDVQDYTFYQTEVQFSPKVGTRWNIDHISVEAPTPLSGIVYAMVYVDNRFICGTATGYGDSADGGSILVASSQILQVVWSADSTLVPVWPLGTIQFAAHIQVTEFNQ